MTKMTKMTEALALASQGFFIFPLTEKSKLPAVTSWPTKATRDPEIIKRWWERRPDCNIGIFTGKFGDGHALLVIDVDVKDDKDGDSTLLAMELQGMTLPPPNMEVATPTGGRHLIYVVREAVKQGVEVLGPGLDIRSSGGYIVGPGSELGN